MQFLNYYDLIILKNSSLSQNEKVRVIILSIQNFAFKTVEEYLTAKNYAVPDYQREFSWNKGTEIDDFWTDLKNLIEDSRTEHFLGQVVVHNNNDENEKYYIIDGQQRTATIVIFLSVMRDLFERIFKSSKLKKAHSRSDDITLKYIGRYDEDDNELKLNLGKTNNEYFKKNIQIYEENRTLEKTENPSNKKIYDAYEFFANKLNEKLDKLDTDEAKYNFLFRYYDSLLKKFKIMYVETTDINEAFIIFETLNARGKELETADLLKNHIFRMGGRKTESVQRNWEKMIETLGNVDPTKLIRHFWNSRNAFAREKDLYKNIRQTIINENQSLKLSEELLNASEVYKSLNSPTDDHYFNNSIMDILISLKTMGAQSFYPIALSMVSKHYSDSDKLKVFKMIEVLVFKNFVIGRQVANKYEILFAQIARNISSSDSYTADNAVTDIKKDIVSDSEFLNSFNIYTTKTKSIIRYILTKINNSYSSEIKTSIDYQNINIEHIMPQKITEWKNITKKEHEEYLWRLGNLTLLGSEYNKKISNKAFPEKKKMYEKSLIKITSQLCNYDAWIINSIQKRQEELGKTALKVWDSSSLF